MMSVFWKLKLLLQTLSLGNPLVRLTSYRNRELRCIKLIVLR